MALNTKLALSYFIVALLSYGANYVAISRGYIFWKGLFAASFAIGIGCISGLLVSRFLIVKDLKKIAEATKKISGGDLKFSLETRSKDEIGQLVSTFRTMAEQLAMVLKEVKMVSESIYTGAMNLSSTSEQMNASTEEVAASIQEIAKGADIQAEMVNRSHDIIKKVAFAIEEIAQKANNSSDLAEITQKKAMAGQQTIEQSTNIIKEVNQLSLQYAEAVREFGKKALQIIDFVKVINNISQQTHLLALNATIEAARAGEYGRGFAVVAEEIRKLSDNTKMFAEKISSLSDEISKTSNEMSKLMDKNIDVTKQSVNLANDAYNSFEDILKAINVTSDNVKGIKIFAKDIMQLVEEVMKVVEEIHKIAENNALNTQELSAVTEEQTASMAELASSAQEFTKTSDKLKSLTELFRY